MSGTDYSYSDNIRSPAQLGVSAHGSIEQLNKDALAILKYKSLLWKGVCAGRGPCASKSNGPLGNRYFLKTAGECKPIENPSKTVNRYMFINNLGEALGGRGIIPGMIAAVPSALNFRGFMNALNPNKGVPTCRRLKAEVVSNNGVRSKQTQYVAIDDLSKSCRKKCSRISKNSICECNEGFSNMNTLDYFYNKSNDEIIEKKDSVLNLYHMGFGLLLAYLLIKFSNKLNKKF